MSFSRSGRCLLILAATLLLSLTLSISAADLNQGPIRFPGTLVPIDNPVTLYRDAAVHANLLVMKAAIFDPIRDGAPDFDDVLHNELKSLPLARVCRIVQYTGPVTANRQKALLDAGVRILGYIPNNALLVRLTPETADKIARFPGVRWIGDYQPAYKLSPELASDLAHKSVDTSRSTLDLAVAFMPDSNMDLALNQIVARYGTLDSFSYLQTDEQHVIFTVPADSVINFTTAMANRGDTRWIGLRPDDKLLNDNSIWVCQSGDTSSQATPVFTHGILGAGQIVAVADSGLDKDHCAFIDAAGAPVLPSQEIIPPATLSVDLTRRKLIAYNVLSYLGAADGDQESSHYHGTHVSGSVLGDNYAHLASGTDAGHDPGDGMAPLAKLIFIDGSAGGTSLYFPYPYTPLWEQERSSGARIANNSWGSDTNQYDLGASTTDRFVWQTEDFLIFVSAGNSGPQTETLTNLGTAKNVICVAATNNGAPLGFANSIAFFSSKGPTTDGRIKPDLAAPGENINSAAGNSDVVGNCGTVTMSGTSMASPTAAGLAALAREYFTDGWYPSGSRNPADGFAPSAALLKAVLINSCANMTGGNTAEMGRGDAPTISQGWGRITLDNALYFADEANDPKLLVWDVPNGNGLITGSSRSYPIHVDEGQQLKLTLVWSDPPANDIAAVALVNDLDLELIAPDGTVYRGNEWNDQLSGDLRESQPDPVDADRLNNVEGIRIKAPVAGDYIVRVTGTNVPGYNQVFTQGYGLVVSGPVAALPTPTVNLKSFDVTDVQGNHDNIIDAGETINLTVQLENTGTSAAGDVSATLSSDTPGVSITSPTADFGALGGQAVVTNSSPFVFQVAPSVANSTRLDFTLTITAADATVAPVTFQLIVTPNTPPTLSNIQLSEGSVLSNRYIQVGFDMDYSDPDADISALYLSFRVNGEEVKGAPIALNAAGLGTSGTIHKPDFNIFQYLATKKNETVQMVAFLEDQKGNRSATITSNVLTFTQGTASPATPSALDDDDTMYVPFPDGFSFPFYGRTYTGCWINSDGNISFGAGYDWQDRSPQVFLEEMPRIAPLFTDLAKTPGDNKITLDASAGQVTITWTNLAQWSSSGPRGSNTFSVTLYPTGAIDMNWGQCSLSESQSDAQGMLWKGVVGISPGGTGTADPVDLTARDVVPIPANAPVYQAFRDTDTFDLSNTSIHFEPQSTFEPVETLYFPRFSFTPGISTEGLGFVNPGDSNAQVRFTAFDTDGNVTAMTDPLSWPAHSQGAFQADGLLDVTQPTDAWVAAECDQPGLLGFFLTQLFNGGLASMDGAGVFRTTISDGILPRIQSSGGATTEIFLANPGDADVDVTITGYDGSTSIDGSPLHIAAHGFVRTDIAGIFGADHVFDGYLRIQSTGGIIGNALIRRGTDSVSADNLTPVSAAADSLYAAHITLVPDNWYTELNIVNLDSVPATVTLSPFNADGSPMSDPFTVTIPANQVVTLRDTELGLPSGVSSDGWLKVESAGHPLLGCLTFGNPVDNHYESTLPLQSSGSADVYFAQVANGTVGGVNFFTGLTIVNPSDTAIEVTIEVRNGDGSLNGSTTLSLAPGEKLVRTLKQFAGLENLVDQATGYLHITATGPVFTFELFGDSALNFISAVPAQF